jgi:hypothetical protein
MSDIVLFGFDVSAWSEMVPNNFMATAFLKHMRPSCIPGSDGRSRPIASCLLPSTCAAPWR